MSARTLDLAAAVLADNPSEWPEASDELRAWLAAQPSGGAFLTHSPRCLAKSVPVRHPLTGKIVHQPAGIVCAADCPVMALERLMAERWFLLRSHESWRCKRCKGRHAYITLGCIERPLNGLNEVMLAVGSVSKDGRWRMGLLTQTDRHEEREITALRLGDVVPITKAKADSLSARIRAKGFTL